MTTEEKIQELEERIAKLEKQSEELSDLLADHGYSEPDND